MEWLNIHRSTIDGEAFQDAEPAERSTWLLLLSYCAGLENGGRIKGAKAWTDRKWLKCCSLSKEEVEGQSGRLWLWEEGDLIVDFYPHDSERILQAKRSGGKVGGKKSAKARQPHLKGDVEGVLQRHLKGEVEGASEGVVERKGREGKEKKGKEREAHSLPDEFSIPSEAEVRTWAEMSGVNPEFASQKHAAASERHGWVQNGQLLDWRRAFKRYWESDREEWMVRFQKKGRATANGKPAGWKEGDQEWWWSEGCELVERALTGALLGGDEKNAARLREVLTQRREGGKAQ